MTKRKNRLTSQLLWSVALISAGFVLVLSWAVLVWMGEPISWSLAPYDTTPLEWRPAPGTWERGVSDFFDAPLGTALISFFMVAPSMALFAIASRKLAKVSGLVRLMLGFAVSNYAIAATIFLSSFIVGVLPLELAPHPGYGWTIKFLIPEVGLLAILFFVQARIIPQRLAMQA